MSILLEGKYRKRWADGRLSNEGLRNWACPENRNKRSVWTVNTKPFNDAHFATFPPELIIPCIKAGCPKEGIVLDPFGGSGTTGMVANDLGRDAILIELNPKNVNDISKRRLDQKSGFFVSKPIIEEHSV